MNTLYGGYYPGGVCAATRRVLPAPGVLGEVDGAGNLRGYPHGRYVLRDDRVTSAYQWMWTANPVAAPSGASGLAAPRPAR